MDLNKEQRFIFDLLFNDVYLPNHLSEETCGRIADYLSDEGISGYANYRLGDKSSSYPLLKKRLEDDANAYRSRNLIFLAEGKKIFSIFKRKKIDSVLIKGIGVIKEAYPDLSARNSSDIDILIRKGDLDRVRIILNKLGYVVCNLHGFSEKYWKKYTQHLPFSKKTKSGDLLVEIHWQILEPSNPFSLDIDSIIKDSIECSGLSIPCREDSILICLSALYFHQLKFFLRAFLDVRLLSDSGIRKKLFLEKAKRYHLNDLLVHSESVGDEFLIDLHLITPDKGSIPRVRFALKNLSKIWQFSGRISKYRKMMLKASMCDLKSKKMMAKQYLTIVKERLFPKSKTI